MQIRLQLASVQDTNAAASRTSLTTPRTKPLLARRQQRPRA